MRIILAAADKEADLAITFKELCYLIPSTNIEIVMIGPLLSSHTRTRVLAYNRLTMRFCNSTVHEFLNHDANRYDMIIGLNAGLAAYATWRETVIAIRDRAIDAYFTDYCLMSIRLSQRAVNELSDADLADRVLSLSISSVSTGVATPRLTLSDPVINPYRSPVRKYSDSLNLPWYSNAFICHLASSA